MSDPSFSKIQNGSLTGNSTIQIQRGRVTRHYTNINATTSPAAGVSVFSTGLRHYFSFSASGLYVTASNTFAKPPSTAPTITGLNVTRISQATIVKRINLTNVTAGGDALSTQPINHFVEGATMYHGAMRGFLLSTEVPLSAETDGAIGTLTFPITGSNTVTGAAVIDSITPTANFRDAGPVPYDVQFRYTGAVTATNTPFTVDSFTASFALDNGQTMSGTVKLSSVQLSIDYMKNTAIPVQLSGVFSGTDLAFA